MQKTSAASFFTRQATMDGQARLGFGKTKPHLSLPAKPPHSACTTELKEYVRIYLKTQDLHQSVCVWVCQSVCLHALPVCHSTSSYPSPPSSSPSSSFPAAQTRGLHIFCLLPLLATHRNNFFSQCTCIRALSLSFFLSRSLSPPPYFAGRRRRRP